MAKKVEGYIKLQIPAGKATPAPPVGPALGQHGVHIVDAHICDPVNVNLGVQHEALEILVADQLRQQPVVELACS
mgnify:CR=1 FL=1